VRTYWDGASFTKITKTTPAAVRSTMAEQEQQQASKKEDWEVQRDANKSLGDTAFRSGNFAEAISHYSQALSLDPTHFVLLSNRSAAYLKNGEKSKALHDAQLCTKTKPEFVKGHSRLAAALQSLKRWGPAKEAYERVLELDKDNAVATKGLDDCMVHVTKEEEEKKEQKEESEEKDLLDDFFDEVETVSTKRKAKPAEEQVSNNIIKDQKTDLGTPESQIARLLAPNYKWRNLNPFFVLDLSHTASDEDVSKRYKALSLLLHPDKCASLPNAKEAYDEVQRAKTQLDDEDKNRHVRQLIEQGNKKGKQQWQASGKKEPLEDVQSREVQRIFAEIEYKRKEVEDRQRKQEQREREQEEEELQKERKSREFDKKWRDDNRVDKRVGSWRGFQDKKSSKKQKF
jgi:DnaJ family protein C protein 8